MNNKIVWLALLLLAISLVLLSACGNGPDEADPIGSCNSCPTNDDDDSDDDTTDDDDDDDNDAADTDEVIITGTSNGSGTGMLAIYDGSDWTVPDIPYLTTNDGAVVYDISLNSATTGYALVDNSRTQVFELTADKGWGFVKFNAMDLDWVLRGIASPSANLTIAVGETLIKNPQKPFILEYNGSVWTKKDVTEDNNAELYDVAALSSGEAWAVGSDTAGGPKVYSRGSAGVWLEVTSLDSFANELYGVTALGSDNVYAVGDNPDDILHYNGTDWSTMTITTDKVGIAWVDVDTDGTNIALVGNDVDGVIAVYDGTWEIFTPDLGLDNWTAKKVEMLGTDNIYVVGSGADSSKADVSVVAHYNGSAWSLVDLSSTSFTSEVFYAVDFFDATSAYFGGANFLLPFDGSIFSTEILPEVPLAYTLTAAISDDDGITAVGFFKGEGLILEGSTKAYTLTMVTDALSFRSITSSALGTFAVADLNSNDETIYEKDGSDWNAVDTTTIAQDESFYHINATDDLLIAVSANMLLTYDGTDWAELTPPDLSPLTNTVFYQGAVYEGQVWVVGQGDNGGNMQGFAIRENGEKAWEVIEFGITEEFTFTTVSAAGYVFFGGYKLDGGKMVPIAYEVFGSTSALDKDISYTTDNDLAMVGLGADGMKGYGVAIETTEFSYDAIAMVRGFASWDRMSSTGFQTDTQPEGIFFRINRAEE